MSIVYSIIILSQSNFFSEANGMIFNSARKWVVDISERESMKDFNEIYNHAMRVEGGLLEEERREKECGRQRDGRGSKRLIKTKRL